MAFHVAPLSNEYCTSGIILVLFSIENDALSSSAVKVRKLQDGTASAHPSVKRVSVFCSFIYRQHSTEWLLLKLNLEHHHR